MPERSDVHYFGAGPAPLPSAVLERASQALLNYKGQGVGICEISHRSADANEILADAKAALTSLLDIPEDYEILFLQGGGSGEFSAVVYNLVGVWVEKRRAQAEKDLSASTDAKGEALEQKIFERVQREVKEELRLDYLVTGSWSLKASQEASRLIGAEYVNVAVDSRKANNGKFGVIPSESDWKPTPGNKAAFTYFCDNETVDGVEFPQFPKSLEGADAPWVVADMSSNFISRKVDVSKYSVIFGGAQKNVGNAGITIVIVKKSLLPPASPQAAPELLRRLNLPIGPIVFDWPTIAKNNSLYNTLPIFDVWIAGQVMSDLVSTYGAKKIAGQGEISAEKANIIYGTLEQYPNVYKVVPDKTVRSRMNICFRVNGGDEEKEKTFLAGAQKIGLLGLKGHRSVGGIRASNYNAVSLDGAKKLVTYLETYATGA
ncbi:phosphoserine aminotransferase [Pseudovirgaria hyperparasitica]|uniref:phosphoserine transaminase n=1 Tax=Pseudovirgaria hyperparasitica TaxID=470096 RepID=A0A6A6W0P3_9PEZI|nr:phosphoserine aminotransferase [Pseudovirgaria hyperparasitica]KAF2755500.1 phosphoserine aminotransferase [Pseudovirgaria hyperparasitica]